MGEITKEELSKILEQRTTRDLFDIIYELRYGMKKGKLIEDILSFDNKTLEEGLWHVMRWDFDIK